MAKNCLYGDFNILVESGLLFILTKSLAFLNIPGHVKPQVLKFITHSVCQVLSPTNSGGLLVIYFDGVLLNRTGILLGEGIENRRKEVDSICFK